MAAAVSPPLAAVAGAPVEMAAQGLFCLIEGSNQLLDDYALKQLLIDGTIAGCALDGAETPSRS